MNGGYSALELPTADSKNWFIVLYHHLLSLSILKPNDLLAVDSYNNLCSFIVYHRL